MVIEHLQVTTAVRPTGRNSCRFNTTGYLSPLSGNLKILSNYIIWDLKQFILTEMSQFPDLVEVVEQAERCSTVLIPINAHHGFSSSCQGVLQVAPPCIIVTVTPSAWLCGHLIWYDHHQTFTNGMKGLLRIGNFASSWYCQATKSARGCFSQNFNTIVQLWWHVFNCASSTACMFHLIQQKIR